MMALLESALLVAFVLVPSCVCQNNRQLEMEWRANYTAEDYTWDFLGELDASPTTFTRLFAGSRPALFDTFLFAVLVEVPSCHVNLPHTHPRGSEVALVWEGELTMGFVEENGGQVHEYALKKG